MEIIEIFKTRNLNTMLNPCLLRKSLLLRRIKYTLALLQVESSCASLGFGNIYITSGSNYS